MKHVNGNGKKVVVVGAGFGGLWAARNLAGSGLDVTLVDKRNYHTFLPLLYQVAAAELEEGEVAHPVRAAFRAMPDVRFVLGEATGLDFERRVLTTDVAELPYDALILALGSQTNFFGVPGAQEHCFTLKALEEGVGLRNQIMTMFEQASLEPDDCARRAMLTFTVVGGGPTGVEFAGALAELIRGPLAKDFPRLDLAQARVVILEAGKAVLGPFPDPLRRYAKAQLERIGVEVRLGAQVAAVTPEGVHMKDGTVLATRTTVWSAGVSGPQSARTLGLPVGQGGRVPVLPTLQLEGRPEVFLVGDMALCQAEGGPLPMLAPVAMQQGAAAARNAVRLLGGDTELERFRYVNRGVMATIGRGAAVASMGPGLRNAAFTGTLAWLAWLFVHLLMLIGFRSRLAVMVNWAWDYLFSEKAVRLIVHADREAGKARDMTREKPRSCGG